MKNRMYIKIYTSYRKVVAICDDELLGKKFEEGKRQLDVREDFYKSEHVDEKKLVAMIKKLRLDDATFNIVGEKSLRAAVEAEIIDEDSFGMVDGIPFALVLI